MNTVEMTVDVVRGLSESQAENVYWYIKNNIFTPKNELLEKGRASFYELRRQAKEKGLQDMTEAEIEEEIRLARMEKNR